MSHQPTPGPLAALLDALLGTAADRHQDMANIIHGLPVGALDWRPAADASSMAGLALHILHVERTAIRLAGGMAADFGANGEGTGSTTTGTELLAAISLLQAELEAALPLANLSDYQPGEQRSIGAMLIEEFDHVAMHYGQLQLTRHLWEAAHPGETSNYRHWR